MALNGLVAYFPAFCHKKQEKCYPIRGVNIVAERSKLKAQRKPLPSPFTFDL
jgi:hypothetical protein